jgi:hypothetical protein
LRIAMMNMTIGNVKPKDEDDDDPSPLFQVLSSSPLLVIKIKLIMWKKMNNRIINRIMILYHLLHKMQVLN